jgi:predicted enzyme related to lactoylglutathione lyase
MNIDVDDMGKVETSYTQAFGLKTGRRLGVDGFCLIEFRNRGYDEIATL